MANRKPFAAVTPRSALLLGFGLTLALGMFSGYDFVRKIGQVQAESDAINSHYLGAQEALSTARTEMLLGSLFVRDALLDPDPGAFAGHRQRIEGAFASAEGALKGYVPVVDSPEERQRFARLQEELSNFRATSRAVLDQKDMEHLPAEARVRLLLEVAPKRESALLVSDEVRGLIHIDFAQRQADVGMAFASVRRRVLIQLSLALAAGLAIGVVATRHVVELDRRLRAEARKDAQHKRDLERLSARLMSIQEEERRRIARDLHDEVGQVLTAIKVDLAVAERSLDRDAPAAPLLKSARMLADGAMQTVRDLSQLLRPTILHDMGLPPAVGAFTRDFGRRHDIDVRLSHTGLDHRPPADVEVAAYRVIQEALTNIAKHAHATRCQVSLRSERNEVTIEIEDNGVGMDQSRSGGREGSHTGATDQWGLGLLGIRERVAALGGSVSLDSQPGMGTRLTVRIPEAIQDTPATNAAAPVTPTPGGLDA